MRRERIYPEDADEPGAEDDPEEAAEAGPRQKFVPIWVVTDLATSGLVNPASLEAPNSTRKAATMLVLAAVLAAWEESTGRHTWRKPDRWGARVLGALLTGGCDASEVETLLLTDADDPAEPDPAA